MGPTIPPSATIVNHPPPPKHPKYHPQPVTLDKLADNSYCHQPLSTQPIKPKTMLQLQQFLTKLGLSEKEIKVYLASLQYGSQPASIIAKKTDLSRSTVNFIFDELIKKGFATKAIKETGQKNTYYAATPPDKIEHLIQEKLYQVKQTELEFQNLSPLFSQLQNNLLSLPKVRYFEGHEGLCRILDDFVAEDQEVLYISGHNMMHPKIREYVNNVYLPICNKHKHKNKIILNEGEKAREYKKLASKAYDEFIFVDTKKHPFTLTTAIYGNCVAFLSYDPTDMTGVIIENKLIADNMRTHFKILKKHFLTS